MNAPSTTTLIFRPTRIFFLAELYRRSPFDPQWDLLLSAALGDPTVLLHDTGWAMGGVPSDRLASLVPELRRGVTDFAQARWAGASATPDDQLVYQGAALYCLWEEFAARIQRIIDQNDVEAPFYEAFADRHRFLFGHPGTGVPEPAHLLALFYQARRAWHFAATRILGRSPSAAAARAAVHRASMGGG